jgi:hypothetical protein
VTVRPHLFSPVFAVEERPMVEAERAAMAAAFSLAGLRPQLAGFPFRLYRDQCVGRLEAPRRTVLAREHAGLLLDYARESGDLRLYVWLPYAAARKTMSAKGDMHPERLPRETAAVLDAADALDAAFMAFARDRLGRVWTSMRV